MIQVRIEMKDPIISDMDGDPIYVIQMKFHLYP